MSFWAKKNVYMVSCIKTLYPPTAKNSSFFTGSLKGGRKKTRFFRGHVPYQDGGRPPSRYKKNRTCSGKPFLLKLFSVFSRRFNEIFIKKERKRKKVRGGGGGGLGAWG